MQVIYYPGSRERAKAEVLDLFNAQSCSIFKICMKIALSCFEFYLASYFSRYSQHNYRQTLQVPERINTAGL